jgi:hypothetical protein
METLNETLALAVVPRAVALVLAFAVTTASAIGTAAVLTRSAYPESETLLAAAAQPFRILFGA